MHYDYKKILSILKTHAQKYNDVNISSFFELKVINSLSKDELESKCIYFVDNPDIYDVDYHILNLNGTTLKFFGSIKPNLAKDFNKIYDNDNLIAYSYDDSFIFPYDFINLQSEILNQNFFIKDSLDRIDGSSSTVSTLDIQDFPLMNQTAFLLKLLIAQSFDLSHKNNFAFISTHDVDSITGLDIYRFLGRFFKCRSLKGLYNAFKFTLFDILSPNKNHIENIIRIIELESKYRITSKWFILNGKRGRYMARSSHRSMKKILKYVPKSDIGVHYNFDTYKSSANLRNQIKLFKNNFNFKPVIGRAHYLKFCMQQSFDIYSENGILEDYSLGYTNDLGFMTSIAGEYSMSISNKIYNLKQHPLYAMDSNISANFERFVLTMNRINIIGGEFNFLVHHDYIFNDENKYEYYQLNKILEEYSKL